MKKEKSCGTIIVNNKKVLIIQQLKSGNFGFPKGHVENNETEVQTAIRETKEETNLDVKILENKRYTISYTKNKNIEKEVVYFLATINDNFELIKQENEIMNIIWVDIENVLSVITHDNLKKMWENVYSDIKRLLDNNVQNIN